MAKRMLLWVLMVYVLILFVSPPCWAATANSKFDTEAIDRYVIEEMKVGRIPGLALGIVRGAEVQYLRGYGVANPQGELVTPQTPFYIGSIGKTFTALAAQQLVHEGKLDPDALVTAYIPWFRTADGLSAKLTVKQLINHTSGFSKQSGNQLFLYDGRFTLEQIVRRLDRIKMSNSPGTGEEYSNINYLVLGLIVEKVANQPYERYLEERIFKPIGMEHSYASEVSTREGGVATGYRIIYGLALPHHMPYPTGHVPSGFQISSVEDMAKYAAVYLSNGYANGSSIIANNPLSYAPEIYQTYTGGDRYYDTYWDLKSSTPQGERGYYGHHGSTQNFTSSMIISPKSGYGIVVLSNMMNSYYTPEIQASVIANKIAAILDGQFVLATQDVKGAHWVYVIPILVIGLLIVGARGSLRLSKKAAAGTLHTGSLLRSIAISLAPVLIIFVGIPWYHDCTYSYIMASSPEEMIALSALGVGCLVLALTKVTVLMRLKTRTNIGR